MKQGERRKSERLLLRVQIRVTGPDPKGGEFREDTYASLITRSGARIALKAPLAGGERIRIVNLENFREADFRVVGPVTLPGAEVREWGVECSEAGRNVWGIEFPAPLAAPGSEGGALLECRSCQSQALAKVTLAEVQSLDSSGIIARDCQKCGKSTSWTYAEVSRRPREIPPAEPVAPLEKRTGQRLAMKFPVLVRNNRGGEEVSMTENISKGGIGVSLTMELAAGEEIIVICPYTAGAQDLGRAMLVRRRSAQLLGGRRLYGLRYAR